MWQMLRKRIGARDGFTLIELVVVVAILGLLAVIVTPKVMGAIDNAKNNSNASSAKQIQVALERYNAEKGGYPAGTLLCGTGWSTTATGCKLDDIKKVLSGYVNLDAANISADATYETPTNDYKLVVTFKETSKVYTITSDSITAAK